MSKAFPTGVNRVIPTALWSGKQIVKEETPENKLFMAYLMSGTFSNNLGIYYLNIKYAKEDLGYDEKVVRTLIRRFNQLHSIIWSDNTQEVAILDHLKYAAISNSANFKGKIVNNLRSVENTNLLISVYEHMRDWWEASPRDIDHFVQKSFEQELDRREVPREVYKNKNNNKNNNNNKHISTEKSVHDYEPRSNSTGSKDEQCSNPSKNGVQTVFNEQNEVLKNEQNEHQNEHQNEQNEQNEHQNEQNVFKNEHKKLSSDQIEQEFAKLWSIYPRKQGKKRAFNHYKAWRKESPSKHTFEFMKSRLEAFNRMWAAKGTAKKFIPYGSSWFNGDFEDDPEEEMHDNQAPKQPHGGFDPNMLTENNDLGVNDDDLPF